jgi:hypothetical protein
MSQAKQTVVSFRVDQHLAEVLNSLPDKSAFIREAILRRFYTACPFCQGKGVMPEAIAEWLQARVPDFVSVECTCCHYTYPAELVHELTDSQSTADFICPHCDDHGHTH